MRARNVENMPSDKILNEKIQTKIMDKSSATSSCIWLFVMQNHKANRLASWC